MGYWKKYPLTCYTPISLLQTNKIECLLRKLGDCLIIKSQEYTQDFMI